MCDKVCEFLRKHVMKIANYEKKKMELLTNEQHRSNKNAKMFFVCKNKCEYNYAQDKKIL